MRTSTAEDNGYRCPKCGDEVAQDVAGQGYVRHLNIPGCDFERGMRDDNPLAARAPDHRSRNEAVLKSYSTDRWSLAKIAEYYGLKPTEVSRILERYGFEVSAE